MVSYGTKIAFTSTRSGNRDIWIIDVSSIIGIELGMINLPTTFKLYQNYPNPFNPTTKIIYTIPQRDLVSLIVYDILGSEVALLVNEEKAVGKYEVEFNATELPNGIYFYTLKSGNFSESKKTILLK